MIVVGITLSLLLVMAIITLRAREASMTNPLLKRIEKQDEENENLVMNCGTFNPRFLAKIKRLTANNKNNKGRTNGEKKATI